MIPQHRIDEVKRLLEEGRLSQRAIAKTTGISRATIGAIAHGRRPDYPPREPGEDELFDRLSGPPVRCHGCGGMVYAPCRLCRVRAMNRQERIWNRRRRWLRRMLEGYRPPDKSMRRTG